MASSTSVFRQLINSLIPSNNQKQVSASKVRQVLNASADAIDGVFETFSLADSIGEFNASTGVAKVTETGATSTPGTTPAFSDGKYFDVVVAGTSSITGASVSMVVGGRIIVRGNKWGYIPPSDSGYALALELQSTLPTSYTALAKFQQVTSLIAAVVADIAAPLVNGYIANSGAFVSSANWRAAIERPVSEGDVIQYNGVRPATGSAGMVGLDANKANPVVLIAGTAVVGGQHSQSITINSTIKFISASSRFIAGDVFTLTKTTPEKVLLKKDKIEGLQADLDQVDLDIADAKSAGTLAQVQISKISSETLIDYVQSTVPKVGYLNSTGGFVSSANFRTIDTIPAIPGQSFTYKGVRPDSTGSAAAVVGFDANGLNPLIIIAKTTTGFAQYTQTFNVPAGIFFLSACSRLISGDIFSLETSLTLLKPGAVPNGNLLEALTKPEAFFMPPISYGKQGDEFRIYPQGIIAMHPKDRGLDLVWNTNLSNEDFGSITPAVSDDNLIINLKSRKVDGSFYMIGQTTLKVTHTTQSPSAAVNVILLGDSLIEQLNGGVANEFSRRLTGNGTALVSPVVAPFLPLNLTNIYFRGTRGPDPVKHEGRSGWGLYDYLYNATLSSVSNAFYNSAAAGAIKFDLNYYLTNNNFQAAQTTGGVDSTGSNLVIYIMLGWNHVYTHTVDQAKTWLGQLMDTIHLSHPNAKIKLFGLNTPPDRIFKSNYSINTRNVSPESIMRDIIAYATAWQSIADARSSYVEFLPVAPFFNPDGCYPSVSKTASVRGGASISYFTDHVHPNNVGYAQIADVAYYNFLYNYCRLS